MTFQVLRTAQVRRVVEKEMDRKARGRYEAARDDLRGRGCQAGGYRMGAAGGGDYPLCGRHLSYHWRLFTAYPDATHVVIVAVDRHTSGHDPARELAEALPGGARSKDKPPCCEDPLAPPAMNHDLRELLDALL